MMTLFEKAAILHYHRHRMEEHEEGTVEALGYRGPESQQKRFEALMEAGEVDHRSVLDIGCGHGDLKGWLDTRFHGFSYVGIDMMPEFVARARYLHGQRPSCYFCLADFTTEALPQADFVFASGLLGYRCADPGFPFLMIERMYAAAERALAFNMLDAGVFPAHALLVGHRPDEILAFCNTLSPAVRLVRGYLDDDFTVVMHKNRLVECGGLPEDKLSYTAPAKS